jgi:hypothetical protein
MNYGFWFPGFLIIFIYIAINGIITIYLISKVRSYLKENHPDKFEELGGIKLLFNPSRKVATDLLVMKFLYGSEDLNDPELARKKRKIKIHGFTAGALGAIAVFALVKVTFF